MQWVTVIVLAAIGACLLGWFGECHPGGRSTPL